MNDAMHVTPSIRERITIELREFAILASYLFVCFATLAYLKAAILRAHNIQFEPWAFAAIKAALCAKFMLVGRALHIGEKYRNGKHPLILPTLHKSFAFFAVLLFLTAVGEIFVGFIHGRTIADSIGEIGGGTLDQAIATCFVMLLIFVPYFAFRSLGDVIGDRTLVRLYFERRRRIDHDHH